MRQPSNRLLSRILRYDADTGALHWRERPAWMFDAKWGSRSKTANNWNARNAGKRAGTLNNGYLRMRVFGRWMYAHRIIYALETGEWPKSIDHDNGVKTDNRFSNLNGGTQADNMKNMKRMETNTSGHTGVSWAKRERKWHAYIHAGGRKLSLGNHDTIGQAVAARKAAERKHGFHENHGR